MKIAREMLMVLIFVACSTAWVVPVFSQVPPEPQQGYVDGVGAPISIDQVETCFAPLYKNKWCMDELGLYIKNEKIPVSAACQKILTSIKSSECWSKMAPYFTPEVLPPGPYSY
ncbi:hypothetical protein AAC387_Pa08g0228 [Persea americana]